MLDQKLQSLGRRGIISGGIAVALVIVFNQE